MLGGDEGRLLVKGSRRGPAGKEGADVGEDLDEDDEGHHHEGEADVEQLARGGGGVPGQDLQAVVMVGQPLSIEYIKWIQSTLSNTEASSHLSDCWV